MPPDPLDDELLPLMVELVTNNTPLELMPPLLPEVLFEIEVFKTVTVLVKSAKSPPPAPAALPDTEQPSNVNVLPRTTRPPPLPPGALPPVIVIPLIVSVM